MYSIVMLVGTKGGYGPRARRHVTLAGSSKIDSLSIVYGLKQDVWEAHYSEIMIKFAEFIHLMIHCASCMPSRPWAPGAIECASIQTMWHPEL